MKHNKTFAEIFDHARQSDSFWEEGAILSFTASVMQRLDALKMTKKNLADKLKVSPAYVTKLIGGSNNFTLRTMVKVARQLKCELNITLRAAVAASKQEPAKAEPDKADACLEGVNQAAND